LWWDPGADYVLADEHARISDVITRDTPWKAMLAEDEREATEEEIAAIEAEHGPFLPADNEG